MVSAALARPDRNAFINSKVETTAELVAQAKRDPSVMDRYMRHFGMKRSEVLDYLGTLKPSTIKEEGVFAIYSVPEGGKIKMHLEKLKKGHRMFALQDGTPQLVLKCGNPVTLGPNQVVALNRTPVTTTEIIAEEEPMNVEVVSEPDYEAVESLLPAEPTAPFLTNNVNPLPLPLGGSGFNPLPLALGGLAFIDTGSSNPVPEPITMVVLGAGMAAVAARRKRK